MGPVAGIHDRTILSSLYAAYIPIGDGSPGERKAPCSGFLLDCFAVEEIGFGAQGWKQAGMAELADAGDLKSPGRKAVWVQVPLPAPSLSSQDAEG